MADLNLELSYTEPQIKIFHEDLDIKYKLIAKGRRFGFTKGAAHACIEWIIEGQSVLWVDTINGNIDKYFERYFEPVLKENNLPYKWNVQKKVLKLFGGFVDFKSAEHPENIEGFGYHKIILNEAGIILKNDDLYTKTILPMLMDFPDSQLIAGGVPKGKIKKNGDKHRFYVLFQRAKGNPKYKTYKYSSYDNPLLTPTDIDELALEIAALNEEDKLQEIDGDFIDSSGSNPFAHNYDKSKHEQEVEYQENKPVYISMDFNLNPFGFIFLHIWRDSKGYHCHQFDEATIKQGNLDKGIEYIKEHYGHRTASMIITGDAMGNHKDFGQRDNASYYDRIQRGLKLRSSQIKVYGNPAHSNSKSDVNYVLAHHPDYKINPKTCPHTCSDMRSVQCDAFDTILKKDRKDLNQRADHLDCQRYSVNSFFKDWIKNHMKGKI